MKIAKIAISSLLIVSPWQVDAWVGCPGLVNNIEQRSDGTLIADWGYGWVRLCNISSNTAMPTSVIPKEACASIYAMILTAQASAKPFQANFGNATSCAQAMTTSGDHMPAEQPYGFNLAK